MNCMNLPRLHVGVGWRADGLTLFPVWADLPVHDLVRANSADVVVAERAGSPAVGEVVLRNGGSRRALLLEGELFEGGWQDRALNDDVLLEPGQSSVVGVSCVEQGRWSGGDRHERRARMVPAAVRIGLRCNDTNRQHAVWESVSAYEPTMGPTRTFRLTDQLDRVAAGQDAAGRPAGRARVRDVDLPDTPLPGQVGVIGALSGRPAWLEILPGPQALADLWPVLVDAALLEAHVAFDAACPGQAARDFAVACRSLRCRPSGLGGAGHRIAGGHRGLTARGILSPEGALLHAFAVDPHHRIWA